MFSIFTVSFTIQQVTGTHYIRGGGRQMERGAGDQVKQIRQR